MKIIWFWTVVVFLHDECERCSDAWDPCQMKDIPVGS